MKETGRLYKATGGVLDVLPRDGRQFQLEELQKFVGGYIEQVPGTGRISGKPIAFCNEDGLRERLEQNILASETFGVALVGDVIEVVRKYQYAGAKGGAPRA